MKTPTLALALVIGCAAYADPPPKQDLVENVKAAQHRMHVRFEATRRMQIAIGLGDLERAHAEAKIIDALVEPDFLPAWQSYVDQIRAAARDVAATQDTVAAAKAAGKLGAACARCHQALSAKLVFPTDPPPPADPRLASQMFTHQWAATRMWEGLVAPDEPRWLQGARTLAGSRIAIAEGGPNTPHLGDDVSRMRLLATRAQQPADKQDRGALYGDLLGACAHCHFVIRDGVKRSK
ncbi:MAG: hypothetical protein ABI867_16515 [Kofleriaceae bacterium]